MRGSVSPEGSGDTAEGAWPPVGSEPREWVSRIDPGHLDVWQRHRIERPYPAAVPPLIAALDVRLDPATVRAEATASAEVARFDTEMSTLPVPMPAILLRSESASSSQIERLTSNARNIAIAELDIDAKENSELVVANVRAMQRALEAGPRVTADTILAAHAALLLHSDPEIAGRWRTDQVWIGGTDVSPHGAEFVPPHADRVPELIEDLVRFAGRDDVTPLAQAALAHAQFETIHPFLDGNGRTGRAIMHTLMRGRGLTRSSTVPVSSGLLRDTVGYFDSLTAYRAGDPDRIVLQASEAAVAAVINGRQLAHDMIEIREGARSALTARSDSAAWRLIDLVMRQPVVNAGRVAQELGVSTRGARNALDELTASGLLTLVSAVRRDRLWQAPRVLTAMDAFARRAGRRAHG
ncbi:Fic family protein [Cellulomonas hominis]|uniref:Fic family protein n=1 Tax=Cellulomonas hominis TaxID=156981 RepID=UPI001B97D894|nr:Fic family protein [Cellulomonas hominis]VTR78703.1 Adenosine monophosphate-protein transferase SoFic [Cellulomonas hominis]